MFVHDEVGVVEDDIAWKLVKANEDRHGNNEGHLLASLSSRTLECEEPFRLVEGVVLRPIVL